MLEVGLKVRTSIGAGVRQTQNTVHWHVQTRLLVIHRVLFVKPDSARGAKSTYPLSMGAGAIPTIAV